MRAGTTRGRRGRRLLATPLTVAALSLSVPTAPAAHAVDACTTEQLGRAEQATLPYVFTGTVTDVAEAAEDGDVTRIYTVKVDRWWRGELPERIRVTSPASAADCGLRGVRKGPTYVFWGREGAEGQVRALSYEGTRRADDDTARQVTRQLGVPAQQPVAAEPAPEEPALTPTVLDDSEPPSVVDSITVPAVVVLVGLLVLGVGALLGRRAR